jgi:hypothetical protein
MPQQFRTGSLRKQNETKLLKLAYTIIVIVGQTLKWPITATCTVFTFTVFLHTSAPFLSNVRNTRIQRTYVSEDNAGKQQFMAKAEAQCWCMAKSQPLDFG